MTLLTQIEEKPLDNYFEPNRDISLKLFMASSPQSHPPTAAHPALPYLQGYLNEVLPDVETTVKDLNAIFYAHLFSPEQLGSRFNPEQAQRIREAYLAQRDEEVYHDIPEFIDNHGTLEDALEQVSKQHQTKYGLKKESLRLRGNTFTYISEFPADDRKSVLEAISKDNREGNFFYDFYKSEVLPHIEGQDYDVVALSVYLPDQVVPTILLASMIKEQNPDIKIVLGGNYLTRFRDVLSRDDELNRKLFDYVDAIIVNEGEVPFRNVLEAIGKNSDFDTINQVIYKGKDGKVTINFNQRELPSMDMDQLPRPNFDGIFTDLENKENVFWTPTPVINLYTQRGCAYAGGCDFCTIMSANNVQNSRVSRSPEKVAEDMKFYQERYGGKAFSFGNETLSRDFMLELTKELDNLGLEAVIDGYTRTDQFLRDGELDREMIEGISKYFRFLQIGVESTDEETLDSMRKGRKPVIDSDLVEALFHNNIFPHAFLITGFPPDKKEYDGKDGDDYVNFYMKSAMSTLKWVIDNQRNLGTFKATTLRVPRDDHKMILGTDSTFEMSPRYNHELRLKVHKDLEFNIPYDKVHGSAELDRRVTELFDMIETPYRTFTHNTIYQQRLFNWEEGINWSIEHPETADTVSSKEREKRVVQRIWTAAVGEDYINAPSRLKRIEGKGGPDAERKRQRLQSIINDTKKGNLMYKNFPDGVTSIQELIEANFDF